MTQQGTEDFEQQIRALDVSLFRHVDSQSTPADRASLLALQQATRETWGDYTYLEIGSHLGGSIQPHLRDPRCKRIFSIDRRPAEQPDEQGFDYAYPENSTRRMLQLLEAVAPNPGEKIVAFDSDARDVDPAKVEPRPQLCFIDGEHTTPAVQSDFDFCAKVSAAGGVIGFHDAQTVFEGLRLIQRSLRARGQSFTAVKLAGTVFAIELGEARVLQHPAIQRMARNAGSFFFFARARMLYRKHLKDLGHGVLRPIGRPIVRYFTH